MKESTSDKKAVGMNGVFKIIFILIFVIITTLRVIHIFNREAKEREFQARMIENGKFVEMQRQQRANEFLNGKSAFPEIRRDSLQALGSGKVIIDAFLKEIRAGNLNAAYAMTSATFRETTSVDDFENLICTHPEIYQPDQCQVLGNARYPGGVASMQVSGPQNATAKSVVEIEVKKEAVWSIVGFKVKTRVN